MSIIVKESVPFYMPSGMHVAIVRNIEETEDLNDPERTKLKVDLETVEEVDGQCRGARFWTSPSLHPKGRLRPFAEAVLGRKLTPEELKEGFDVSILIQKQLCVVVKEDVSKNGKAFARVVDFFAVESK